ncbi:Calcium-dependent secretion activator 2, partial [Dissostichus eleginoides]
MNARHDHFHHQAEHTACLTSFFVSCLLLLPAVLLQVCVSSLLQKPGMDLADTYITFIRQNQDILRDRVNDELYTEKVFEQWYSSSVKLLCVWLTDRMDLQLHVYQLKTLIKIVKTQNGSSLFLLLDAFLRRS